ncbi:MAG: hypothetical protein LBR17_03020 [Bacteroidales bacterium]|nr:hypothetical protein [Bacteroidales bacterium]
MAKVKILNEVPEKYDTGEWTLCFQWCEYIYENEDDEKEFGYRFILRRPLHRCFQRIRSNIND